MSSAVADEEGATSGASVELLTAWVPARGAAVHGGCQWASRGNRFAPSAGACGLPQGTIRETGPAALPRREVRRNHLDAVRSLRMHELSIAIRLVELAADAAQSLGAAAVSRLFVRLGAEAGVAAEALRFSFDLAAEGTIVQGARLELEPIDGPNLELSAMEVVDATVPASC